MRWIEFKININNIAVDILNERLVEMGAAGISSINPEEIADEVNPILLADKTQIVLDSKTENSSKIGEVRAYFVIENDQIAYNEEFHVGQFSDFNGEDIYKNNDLPSGRIVLAEFINLIKADIDNISSFIEVGKYCIEHSEIDPDAWISNWQENYKPFILSDNIFIEPTWKEINHQDNPEFLTRKVIKLDPGSAFGSGTHATTMTSAQMLDKYISKDMRVLDLGTGSGILAIVAAKLGARQVDAIDIDENAIRVATENAINNDVDAKINFRCGELNSNREKYDMVVANLLAGLIIDLAPEFANHMLDDACIILSGIVDEKADKVMEAFNKEKFTLIEKISKDSWTTLVYTYSDKIISN